MADFKTASPLDAFFDTLGSQSTGGVNVKASTGHGVVQVFAVKGKTAAVERALGIKETPGQATAKSDYTAIPLSPGEWMLVSSKPDSKGFAQAIGNKLKNNGYVSEQSDARVIFSLSGPKARDLMIKGCRLDLHPSVTGKGWCAQTQMAQVGVVVHQTSDEPGYDLLVYSGFAQHFAEWLLHTGLQLGISFSR